MFSGLIEGIGDVAEVKGIPAGRRVRIATSLADGLAPGDSIAVNGVCLTVVLNDTGEFHAEVSPETARVTTLGDLRPGIRVNLERPLRADARLGGHFVLGHVDEVGHIDEIRQEADFYWVTLRYPEGLAPYLVRKGSVAVDGISLTVAGLSAQRFDVQIVPYTWTHTNLQAAGVGDGVNLECDIIGKYVVQAVRAAHLPSGPPDDESTP